MTRDQLAPNQDSGKSSGKGCLFWGFIIAGSCAIIVAVTIGFMAYSAKKLIDSVTDTKPETIPTVSTNASENRHAKEQYSRLENVINEGSAESFSFDERQLNTLVAVIPQAEFLRGKATFNIKGDRLIARASVPLDRIPMMQGRYLNGEFELDIKCENGILEVYAQEVRVKGEPIPESVMSKLRNVNLAQEVYKNPDAIKALKRIESLEVKDDKLVVNFKKIQ